VDHTSTIIGNVQAAGNCILRNLRVTNPYRDPVTNGGSDAITVNGITNVLITHCTIYNAYDGLCDISRASDNVTVSWCKFYYTDPSQTHRFTMISGNDPNAHPRITLHHNWWAQNCHERMPSGSWNTVHMYNNYFTCAGNYYCSNTRDGGEMLSENNYYLGVNDPIGVSLPPAAGQQAGRIRTSGNIYVNCTGTIWPGTDTAFMPPYVYTPDDVADVPAIVVASAGNRLYGDFNGDNNVDAADLEWFSGLWLSNTKPAFYLDIDGDGTVSFREFARFAQSWLATY
jgi:pectate lyase